MSRVHAIVEKLHVSEAWVLRRAVLQGLAEVEKEVLGMSPPPVPLPSAAVVEPPAKPVPNPDVLRGDVVVAARGVVVHMDRAGKNGVAA